MGLRGNRWLVSPHTFHFHKTLKFCVTSFIKYLCRKILIKGEYHGDDENTVIGLGTNGKLSFIYFGNDGWYSLTVFGKLYGPTVICINRNYLQGQIIHHISINGQCIFGINRLWYKQTVIGITYQIWNKIRKSKRTLCGMTPWLQGLDFASV